jgi:hypothetical protein
MFRTRALRLSVLAIAGRFQGVALGLGRPAHKHWLLPLIGAPPTNTTRPFSRLMAADR